MNALEGKTSQEKCDGQAKILSAGKQGRKRQEKAEFAA
jgi:hypothetical protein